MPMTLKESDSYSMLQEILDTAVKHASMRIRGAAESMEHIDLATGAARSIVRYTDDGLTAIVVPETLEKPAVRLDNSVILVPEDTTLAIRVPRSIAYAPTSSDAILNSLRRSHRNKRQVIASLQPYVTQLENLESWTVELDAINRKQRDDRENSLLFGEPAEEVIPLPESDTFWDEPALNTIREAEGE